MSPSAGTPSTGPRTAVLLSVTVVGQGRPVVLLPGFALDSGVMAAACEPVFARTVPDRWQRIYLDLPGTGRSSAGEPTSEAVLAAVQSTVNELIGNVPFLLVGHSYGAYLAAGLARRIPERIAGLFLVCSGSRIRPADRDLSGALPSTPETGWLEEVPEELRQHFEQAIGHQTAAVANRVAAVLKARSPRDEAYLDALRPNGYQLDDEPDGRPEAGPGPVNSPVMLLAGRRDRIAGHRDPVAALSQYPHAGISVRAEAGHYLPFEQPEAFSTSLLGWLASIAEC